ncbi:MULTISPECIES: UrcA family protein [unclassified Novosphingobium]|uniref:UrcA family protein n=1 Tax=unclassified Novosphingobium TaxID=2644732 RepID=UPI00135AC46B|nr:MULTISPECIES: UrcA family protein [unclassified Novosphingobium]
MKIGLLALVPFAFAAAASAAPNENPFAHDRAVVQLQGLDLATVEGQQRLSIRMDQAARAVCGDRLSTVHLALEQRASECRTAVKADIKARIEARMADASGVSKVQLASAR